MLRAGKDVNLEIGQGGKTLKKGGRCRAEIRGRRRVVVVVFAIVSC